MKIKLAVALMAIVIFNETSAQQKPYFTNGFEFIFSYGLATDSMKKEVNSTVRFSAYYHYEKILNIDFSKHAGLITGLGLQNIGMITRPTDSVNIKQRVYSLNLPVGFRFGNFDNRNFFTLGATGEWMMDYKEKVFIQQKKTQKHHEWLSNNTNLVNAAVFVKWQKKSVFISAKYYLMDIFKPSTIHYNNQSFINAYPQTSQLFLISIGYSGRGKSKGKTIENPPTEKVNLI